MYHVELRQFPHNFCRFNLTERELHETVLDGWSRGEWIELGERKWNPHQASLMVLEGPQLPVQQLSMGRGWRNAVRQGIDVTERLLASVRAATGPPGGVVGSALPANGMSISLARSPTDPAGAPGAGRGDAIDVRLAADSLGLEVLASLGTDPVPPAIAWRLARERYPDLAASDCLKLAEQAIHSLVQARLAVVLTADETGEPKPCASSEQVQRALLAINNWTSTSSGAVLLRRA